MKTITHLKKDKILAGIISENIILEWGGSTNLFANIVENIIGQQLSGAPTKIITKRFIELFKTKTFPKPIEILEMEDFKIRDTGMSWAKVKYVKNLSQAVLDGSLDLEKIKTLSDEEVITELIKIKGIGRWTAEMILIFHLQRPDVFSLGDLGLRTAVSKLYNVDRNDLKKIEKISLRWRPFRSLASRYLWKSLDNE